MTLIRRKEAGQAWETGLDDGGGAGGGVVYTRFTIAVPELPISDPAVNGEGVAIYTPQAGEIYLHHYSGISIAPGDEFDGDYQVSVAIDGFQETSEFGSAFAGDVDNGPDMGAGATQPNPVYGNAGFWKFCRPLGPYAAGVDGSAIQDWILSRSYFVDDSPLMAYLTNGPGAAPTVGVVTFCIVTIPPA